MSEPIDYRDHDPLVMSAEAEASLLAAILSTEASHPDYDYLRRFQPLDLKGNLTDR